MNKTKLLIKTSPSKDLIFKIYRSESQELIANELNVLNELEPIFDLDEAAAEKSYTKISEELREGDTDNSYDMIQYKLRNNSVISDNYNINIDIFYNNPKDGICADNKNLRLDFNSSGELLKLTIASSDTEDQVMDNTVDIKKIISIDDDIINISKDYVCDIEKIVCSYFIEVLAVEDSNKEEVGKVYYGPEPIGIGTPKCNLEYKISNPINSTYIPYFLITPDTIISEDYYGKIYFYRIVSINKDNLISNPSNLCVKELYQKGTDVKHYLDVSKNYNYDKENAVWDSLGVFESDKIIEIGRPESTLFNTLGTVVNDDIPVFTADDIYVNTKYIYSDSKLILTYPNVWSIYNKDFNYRYFKAYRITAECDNKYSNKSDILTINDKAHIPIDKMVIIKRVVTEEDDNSKILPSDLNDGNTIKTYVRKNGCFYDESSYMPLPINVISSDSIFNLITEDSIFKTFELADSCIPGEEYNYTIYLFDSYGKQSNPIVKNITI